MKTRGEEHFIRMPGFAVKIYDNLTSVRGVKQGFEEIAGFVFNTVKPGNLLDIGTGPGRLLYEFHRINPHIELYGLDISASMLGIAKQNLKFIDNIHLQVGNIANTGYRDDFFDCIVSTGSFYLWDKPVEGINEIFRILKKGRTAYIFETHKEYDNKLLNYRLKRNLKGYFFLRRMLSKRFLKKQLHLTYSITEIDRILLQTKFKNSYNIQQTELGDLPVYVRLELKKNEE